MMRWAIALSFSLVATFVAAQEGFYRLAAKDLACIAENAPEYRAIQGDPVFVITTECPPTGVPSLFKSLVNEAPDLDLDQTGIDSFLALTRENLDCLERLSIPKTETIVHFFPDECRFDVE